MLSHAKAVSEFPQLLIKNLIFKAHIDVKLMTTSPLRYWNQWVLFSSKNKPYQYHFVINQTKQLEFQRTHTLCALSFQSTACASIIHVLLLHCTCFLAWVVSRRLMHEPATAYSHSTRTETHAEAHNRWPVQLTRTAASYFQNRGCGVPVKLIKKYLQY